MAPAAWDHLSVAVCGSERKTGRDFGDRQEEKKEEEAGQAGQFGLEGWRMRRRRKKMAVLFARACLHLAPAPATLPAFLSLLPAWYVLFVNGVCPAL